MHLEVTYGYFRENVYFSLVQKLLRRGDGGRRARRQGSHDRAHRRQGSHTRAHLAAGSHDMIPPGQWWSLPSIWYAIIASAKRACTCIEIGQPTHTVVSHKWVATPKRNRKYHGAICGQLAWGKAFWGGGSWDLKLAKMYVIEKCCNGYRPRSCKP